jgi:beta-glucosidase
MFPMPGVGEVPKEGMAALQAELASTGDVEQYARKEYGAVSLAEAVRKLLPGAQVTAYYGGPHQGPAIADAICGVTKPGGKLPITIPRHVGQVPIHHGQRNGSGYRRTKADIHKGYLDMPSTPLFAFGHGLSYMTFQYSPLRLASDTVDVNGELRLSLTITNTGTRRGTEVVQLCAADTATGVTLPAQQLVGFARLDLDLGASKTVSFVVPMSLLTYTGISGALVMEPRPVEVSAGSSSSDIRSSAKFTVTGQTRTIRGEDRAFLSVATVGS